MIRDRKMCRTERAFWKLAKRGFGNRNYCTRSGSSEIPREGEGAAAAEAARNLGIHPNPLRKWKQGFAGEQENTSLTEDERMEITPLRAENRRLRMERDILARIIHEVRRKESQVEADARKRATGLRSMLVNT